MNDITILLLVPGAGCLIGTIFYGGLRWTIQKGILSPRPALWFFCSFWLRIAIALAGFYAVADGDWKRLLACLAGFVVARVAVTKLKWEFACAD